MAGTGSSHAVHGARIQAVEAYIHANLDQPIDLARLADIACLSPYHWHRVYHALKGETIHATVSRLRLQRAAGLLSRTDRSLQQVARNAGYSAVPPFSRAFKARYGVSPLQYRSAGPHARYRAPECPVSPDELPVVVRQQPEFHCAAIAHTGSYLEVDRAFSELSRRLAANGLHQTASLTIGVYFDDPGLTDAHRLESLACAAEVPASACPDSLEPWVIPGGHHAVLRHIGPYDALDAAYQWLFGSWLTGSGQEPSDAPVYEIYRNDPRHTAPMDLLVDICLPLQ